jgi:HTH-type transcriptional regulator/antitoxin HigA
MEIKPIKTRKDYDATLKEIESLMSAGANTPEGDRLDVLVTLVEAYESRHFPMDLPDAVDAIKFRMEQAGLGPKDLQPVIGQMNRVYEVLSRRRPLTLRMIEGLSARFGIPAESLIKQRVVRGARRRLGGVQAGPAKAVREARAKYRVPKR